MHSGDRWRLGHRPGLDGLRGVAIALVLLTHGAVPFSPSAGRVGVTLFFVLSGFLITSLLLEENRDSGRISLRAFYGRRVRRLGPAFVLCFAVTCVLGVAAAGSGFLTVRDALLSISYVGNWYPALMHNPKPAALGGLSGTWSLAVEEQFYLVWPLVLILAARRGLRMVAGVAAVGVLLSLVLRFALFFGGASGFRIYYGTDTNALALLAGVLIAVYLVGRPAPVHLPSWVSIAAVVGLFAAGGRSDAWVWLMLPAVAFSVAAVWSLGAKPSAPAWLTAAWLRWLGRRSYAVYLWNTMISVALFYVAMPWPLRLVVTAGVPLLLAELSWRCVESPVLRALRSRRTSVAVLAADPV